LVLCPVGTGPYRPDTGICAEIVRTASQCS
jgi:hypothetical protein